MARKYWKGGDGASDSNYGDMSRAGNWQLEDGSATAVPAAGDVLVFDGRATVVPEEYSGSHHTIGKHYNAYVSTDAYDGFDLDGLVVTEDSMACIGISTHVDTPTIEPLEIHLAAGKEMVICGNETYYIECSDSAAADAAIPLLVWNSETGELALDSRLNSGANVHLFTKILVLGSGNMWGYDGVAIGEIVVAGSGTPTISMEGNCFNAKTSALTILTTQAGGTLYLNSPMGAIVNCGSTIYIGKSDFALTNTGIDIDSIMNYAGTTEHRASGRIKAFEVNGGILACTGDGEKQIGEDVGSNIHYVNGGILDFSEQTGHIEMATNDVIELRGTGALKPPKNSRITFTKTGSYS